jgi:hypothetical protein
MYLVLIVLVIAAVYSGYKLAILLASYLSNGKAILVGVAYLLLGSAFFRFVDFDPVLILGNFGEPLGLLPRVAVFVHTTLVIASLFSIGGIGHYVKNTRVAANNSLKADSGDGPAH